MNIILVDTSYTTFHRFFASIRWFSFAKKKIYTIYKNNPTYDWSQNIDFMNNYKKMYLKGIIDLIGETIFKKSIVIFCMDAPQNTLWRNEITSCYKGNRTDMTEKYNLKPTFKYTYDILIPELLKTNPHMHSILRNNMEADDIIALATRYIRYKHSGRTIYIVSGDADFLQLGYKNLYIADYKKKNTMIHLTHEEAREALRRKIVVGDNSDNIPSIFPPDMKISNKTKKQIREYKDEMKLFLEKNDEVKKLYLHNKKLISFRYIPKHFRKPIYKIIKHIIKNNKKK